MMAAKKTVDPEKTYQVQWLLSYNGNDYKQGEMIALSDNDAAHFIETGVITLIETK